MFWIGTCASNFAIHTSNPCHLSRENLQQLMGQKLSLNVEAPLKYWKNKHELEERQNVISLNILVHKTHLKHWDICKRKISNNCNVNYRHMPCKFFLKSHRYACLLESSQLCATFRHLGMENNWASIASIYEIHCKRQPCVS